MQSSLSGSAVVSEMLRAQSFLAKRDRSLAELLVGWLLLPFSLLYLTVVTMRRTAYSIGLCKSVRLPVKVISVGGITVGGSGKTPAVIHIAEILSSLGKSTLILTRGYGGDVESPTVLYPDGNRSERRRSGISLLSDEVELMAARTESAIGIGRDRLASFKMATTTHGFDAAILDDGFQHLKIKRDLEIVVLDATAPFGSGHLLPSGNLREPRRTLKQADLILLTRISQADDRDSVLAKFTRDYGVNRVVASNYVCDSVVELHNGKATPMSELAGLPLCAVAAIANPDSFFKMLTEHGLQIRHRRAFVDHHIFTQAEMREVAAEAISVGCRALIVTEKDAVKLEALDFCGLDVYVYRIRLQIAAGEANLHQSLLGLFDD